jgi:hypothetical protein
MQPQTQLFIMAFERKLQLLQQCKKHLEKKMLCLLTCQLPLLEANLAEDAELQEEIFRHDANLEKCKSDLLTLWGCQDHTMSWKSFGEHLNVPESLRFKELLDELKRIVEEIQTLNAKNLALLESGKMYAEALLNALWPATTYSPDKANRHSVPPSRISVEC